MTTNDDEIKWEIERLRIYAHEQIPLAYKEEVDSRIQQAIDLARADERKQIQKILNRGLLHSKDKAIDDIINYLNKVD